MNSEMWKKMVKNGVLFMVFCFSLSFFYGAMAQASTPSSQTSAFLSHPYLNNGNSENFAIGFENAGRSNFIMPYSTSNTVDIMARVYVKSYHRKDGTYVRSHYRRDPR